jgi:GNAT superfamily N-acetyltransferase
LENHEIIVRIAHGDDGHYAETITEEMASSAKARGTGIAKRSPDYIRMKMEEGKAVIAITPSGDWVGFCYIEAWSHGKFVANSGLVVSPTFRGSGVATRIKEHIFELSRLKYPDAKIFGLTTGLAVMKINSELGYKPVTYSELTDDEEFWKGCQSCVNYDILMSKERKNCLCTGMLYDPAADQTEKDKKTPTQNTPDQTDNVATDAASRGRGRRLLRKREFRPNLKLYERWLRFKKYALLKGRKEENGAQGGSSFGQRRKFFTFFHL